MKLRKMIRVMKAAAIGFPIQYRCLKPKGLWLDCPGPRWNWVTCKYRVKRSGR